MADQSTGKKIILVLISFVFLTITYFVFSKYVFHSDIPSLSINLVNSENTEATVARIKGKTKNIKLINSDIFNDEKFRSLKERAYKRLKLDSYKRGKVNPFEAKVEKKNEELSEDLLENSETDGSGNTN